MDYEKLDTILSKVEEIVSQFARERQLEEATIERWRWDEPVVTLRWVGRDTLGRAIHARIVNPDAPLELLVELNAWQDEDREEGTVRMRKYHHDDKVGHVPIDLVAEQLAGKLDKAYSTLESCKVDDLKQERRILPSSAVGAQS